MVRLMLERILQLSVLGHKASPHLPPYRGRWGWIAARKPSVVHPPAHCYAAGSVLLAGLVGCVRDRPSGRAVCPFKYANSARIATTSAASRELSLRRLPCLSQVATPPRTTPPMRTVNPAR